MGDSEDEYDRKRRDKFRGERTESYRGGEGSRRTGSDDRRRDEWIDRESWSGRNRPRQDYRDYRGGGGGGGRERYSPPRQHDISPPLKRMRHEWRAGFNGGHDVYPGPGYGPVWQPSHNNTYASYGTSGPEQRDSPMETQPPMQSFKQYLQTQDDNITDDEAIRKYNEYKLEFKRFQLNEFFVTHKDEEWFKIKYHPEEAVKRKEEQMQALGKRVDVFLEFLTNNGRLDKLSVDNDQSEQLVRLLDAVVIRLEGGTDFDLQVLDEQPKITTPAASSSTSAKGDEGGNNETAEASSPSTKKGSGKSKEEDEEKASEGAETVKSDATSQGGGQEEPKGKKRKREYDSEADSVSESGDEQPTTAPNTNGVDAEENPDTATAASPEKPDAVSKEESNKEDDEDKTEETNGSEKEGEGDAEGDNDTRRDNDTAADDAEGDHDAVADDAEGDNDAGVDNESEPMETDKEVKASDESTEKEEDKSRTEDDDKDVVEVKDDSSKKDEEVKPRPLHRTASIFLRNLAPTITKQEVEAMCKRYSGFLRVAIADPQPDRRWFRRGWVTFERNVNIKEICWNLNNIRLRDCELGAIVNRDLSRRIRTVSGITSHKQVVRHDIKLTAKIVHNLDAKSGIWQESTNSDSGDKSGDGDSTQTSSFGLVSKNPVLKNITDYLIEEASAEEEELLGQSADQEEGQLGEDSATIERDDTLIKVLDRLLLYLRIVHSVDYYNHCEYPNEDEMPNRCGIMHARGTPPSTKVTQQEVTDYCRMFEQKIASFLQPACKVSEEEFAKLGAKQADIEVEKFVQANTQEIAKDKYLCPLSGKKFKGPEFVRKHIFNKHGEKVEEVKKEVEYFNNYLKDPKRPQLPEHPQNRQDRKAPSEGSSRDSFSAPHVPYPPHYQMNYGGPRPGNYHNYGGAGSYGGYHGGGYNSGYSRGSRGGYSRGRGGGSDFRPVIHYRDLDAPREPDEFI